MSDEEFLKLFKNGDGQAGAELLVRYKNKVLSIARKFFLSGDDIEDLVQEGMCGLYSAMTTYRGDGAFAPYAYTCIKNRILDAVRKANDTAPMGAVINGGEGELADNTLFTPEEVLIYGESEDEFNAFMKSELSSFEYEAFKMYVEGIPLAEISSSLDKSYKQIDNAVSRAKQKLRISYTKLRG